MCSNRKSVAVVVCKQSSLNSTSCNFDTGYCGWSQPLRNLRMDWTWQKSYVFPGTSAKRTGAEKIFNAIKLLSCIVVLYFSYHFL